MQLVQGPHFEKHYADIRNIKEEVEEVSWGGGG